MHDVRIEAVENGAKIAVTTPYNRDFLDAARSLGGKWTPSRSAWVFDVRDRERVEKLLREIYGTDGSPASAVTVRVRLATHSEGAVASFAGRRIAERRSRDTPVRLSDGVVLIQGTLRASGGSVKYPAIAAADDVVVEIRDLPRAALDVEDASSYEIVDSAPVIDRAGLEAERARLLARINEIDAQLATLTAQS